MIKLRTKNLGIIEAVKKLKEISLTDNIRFAHELRLQAKRDREAEDEFVLTQGIERGREEEREKNLKILINALREHGDTDEQIVKYLMDKYQFNQDEAEKRLKK